MDEGQTGHIPTDSAAGDPDLASPSLAAPFDSPEKGESECGSSGADAAEARRGLVAGLRLVSLCTLGSRILGLARDTAMAVVFGNSAVLDAFTVAFRLPNMARRLFGEGAFTAAFLPLFVEEHERRGPQQAWKLASTVLVCLAGLLVLLVGVGELGLLSVLAVVELSFDTRLLLGLTAVMTPYLLFVCLSAQVSAVLNARDHFFWPAMLPVLLNLVWLFAVGLATRLFEEAVDRVYFVAAGISLAGVLQLAAPWRTLQRLGFRLQFDWVAGRRAIGHLTRSILPVVIGLSITQLNTLVDAVLAWLLTHAPTRLASLGLSLPAGTASALYFGQRLYQFPLGVFGIALGTVIYPRFSRHATHRDHAALRDDFELAIRLVLLIGIPSSVGLMLLAQPLATLLFQYGQFGPDAAVETARMIAGYGAGVWAYCGLLIVNRLFYAIGDQQTPLRSGIVALVCNIPISLTLMPMLGGAALAASTSICSAVQAALMLRSVRESVGELAWGTLGRFVCRVVLATLLMGALVWLTSELVVLWNLPARRVLQVLLPCSCGIAGYLLFCRALGLDELQFLLRRSGRR